MAHLTDSDTSTLHTLSIAYGSQLSGRLGLGLLVGTAAVFVALFVLPVFAGSF